MAATEQQKAALRARLLDTPPQGVPFAHVVDENDVHRFMILNDDEIAQRQKDEAEFLAEQTKPLPPTLEERIAALEAKLK